MSVRPRHLLPGAVPSPEALSRIPRPSSRRASARPLELRFLGGFEVVEDGQPVHGPVPRKVQALLAYLTLAGGHAVSRDLLAGLLWSGASEAAAHQSLRQAIYSLRRHLGAASRSAVGSDAREVWLDPAIVAAGDVARFEAVATLATAAAVADGPHADPVGVQESIAALYRGELLEGLFVAGCERFNEWLEGERSRLRALAIAALLALLDRREIDGRLEPGMAAARQLLVIDPLSEEAHRHLIRLLARAGRRDEALAEFEAWRGQLARDLGAQPTRAAEALHRTLLSGGYVPDVPAPLDGVLEPLIPFVGRERELAALFQEWEKVRRGGHRVTLVSGEAGAGKSRLVRTFLEQIFAIGPGQRVVIVPADQLDERETPSSGWESRVGFARGCGTDPGAVVLLLEAFESGQRPVAELVRGLELPPELPIWILATWRGVTDPSALPVLGELAASGGGATRIRLGRLDADAMRTLAAALVGPDGAESLADVLLAATGGLAWAVAEAVNLLTDEGVLERAGPGWRLAGPVGAFPLPGAPDALVARRLALLPRSSRRLLTLAAVAGTRFDAALLAAAEGESRSAVEAGLATLVDRRFVRPWIPGWLPQPRGGDRALAAVGASCGQFEFLCPTLREAVCRLLPEPRRRAVELEIEAARTLSVPR